MPHYLVTFHESDGNDCSVYDAVVEADSEDTAYGKVCDALEKQMDADHVDYEADGDFGYYFQCSEDCPEDCEGHGGIVMREAERYETREQAEAERDKYHGFFYVE